MMAVYIHLIFSKGGEAWKLHYMKWKRAREPNMPTLSNLLRCRVGFALLGWEAGSDSQTMVVSL